MIDVEIVRELAPARLRAVTLASYYATALWKLVPVRTPGLKTMAVDANWRLYYDPETLAVWGPEQAAAVLTHEVGHLIRSHHARAEAIGNIDRTLWNYAGDAAINDDLIRAGFALPDPVTPEYLGLPADGIEETYYELLRAHADPASSPNDPGDRDDQSNEGGEEDEMGCGSGAGAPALPCELPANDPDTPAVSAATARITRRQVAEAVREHASSKGVGSVPAGLHRWAQETLSPPRIDWRTQFASMLRRAVAWHAGQMDWTYSRPGRRQLPGIITPAMREPALNMSVVVDTSGSMSATDLTAALAEVGGIIKAGRNRALTVVTCDSASEVTVGVHSPSQITLTGGGGTDMRIGIDAALAARPRPDVVVVLTDGGTPWPAAATPVPLVIGLINPMSYPTPPWAKVVHIC